MKDNNNKEIIKVSKTKKIVNFILVVVGTISLALGTIGIVLPILPTTPFFLLTLVCYTKGSIRFELWFKSTKLYHKYLEPFIKTKAMSNISKIEILILVTGLISIPIIMVDVLPMRIVLIIVILFHYYIFIFKIKSLSKEQIKTLLEEIRKKEETELTNSNVEVIEESNIVEEIGEEITNSSTDIDN
jgi:uncharacterized membrane protein YbaN (DUF454 family)